MKSFYFRSLLAVVLTCLSAQMQAQDSLFISMKNGELYVFPNELVTEQQETSSLLIITTEDEWQHRFDKSSIASMGTEAPSDLPTFTSFKINNKYNDQVFTDVIADLSSGKDIKMQIGAIGRWLTPSFNTQPATAGVYVDAVQQTSKESRLNFANPVTYTVARDNSYVFTRVLVSPEEISDDAEYTSTKVELTADMISTNAPSNHGEDPVNMLDGDINTFFHSTWGDGPYEKLPLDEHPYLDFALPEALHHIQFSYTLRSNSSDYYIEDLLLQASNDGVTWKNIREFTLTEDNLPTSAAGTFISPIINLGQDYLYLRLEMVKGHHKNYLVLSEFSLYKVEYTGNGGIISPAEYKYEYRPYGREYPVNIEWLTDKATRVPRIDINIENGAMVSSKDYYLNAEIIIDGAGVFPSMTDSVQIKGRGNTSWDDYPYAKNPYRLKFVDKVKPFGLTKGRNWVLLANKQYNSMMANAVGMKIACVAGTPGANHIVPVDLYMNGSYRGSYMFTEKVGLANNSVDLDDESTAALLELDTYYDETYKFRSAHYNLPVNIKEPDFTDPEITITQSQIQTDWRRVEYALKNNLSISSIVDLDYLARFFMVNELIMNYEIMHPKSTFLYKEVVGDANDPFIFGPIWDLDWAFGYENNRTYFEFNPKTDYWTSMNMEATQFIKDLRTVDKKLDKAYYRVWRDFMKNGLDEVLDYCIDYYKYAKPSFEMNAYIWGEGSGYEKTANNAQTWLKTRAEYIFSNLTPYEFDDDPIEDGIEDIPAANTTFRATLVDVYDVRGICVKRGVSIENMRDGLAPGVYVVNGKKIMVK